MASYLDDAYLGDHPQEQSPQSARVMATRRLSERPQGTTTSDDAPGTYWSNYRQLPGIKKGCKLLVC